MLEMTVVMWKAIPVVFLAGVALFPVSAPEDVLIRTAAGVTAAGIIWLRGIRPVVRFIQRGWQRVERAFDDISEVKRDLKDVKRDLNAHVNDRTMHRPHLDVISTEGQEPPR